MESGVNFRRAGGVREQVAGSLARRQPGSGCSRVREGAVTPSLHPEPKVVMDLSIFKVGGWNIPQPNN